MPIYDFQCQKCQCVYDDLCPYDEKGKYPGVSCPKCRSKKKARIFSGQAPAVMFGNPKESSKWDNFIYRAGYNMDKAKDERRVAEEKSHMGTSPYSQIDDLNNGNYFGEVK